MTTLLKNCSEIFSKVIVQLANLSQKKSLFHHKSRLHLLEKRDFIRATQPATEQYLISISEGVPGKVNSSGLAVFLSIPIYLLPILFNRDSPAEDRQHHLENRRVRLCHHLNRSSHVGGF